MKAREVKRAKLVARYAEKRAALKKIIATADVNTEEGAMAAYEAARKLQSIPRNANPIRLHNRCKITGRPKGYMRQFGLNAFLAAFGAQLPILNSTFGGDFRQAVRD